MWDDAQALRKLTNALFGISFALVLFGALHFALHLPVFPLRAVQLSTAPQRVEAAQVEAVVREGFRGNFFTVDLEEVRKAFEHLPWVRKASVRREFPWKLKVELEEQVALAHWNDAALVNTHGEVFAGECERVMPQASGTRRPPLCGESEQAMPKFVGQPDSSAEVTQMYHALGEQIAPLKRKIAQISLSPRRAWQLRLDNGMVLELGRDLAQQRLARFVAVYPYSLATLPSAARYVDLRYRNGFAASLPGGQG
ncbi:MAG: FtsQ-type POTRA domain-containing protein [Nitrosomonadales bacterium]|nr:FtsQ-type POTRA domain-containing protein [Nitrosomonadales bacterium]